MKIFIQYSKIIYQSINHLEFTSIYFKLITLNIIIDFYFISFIISTINYKFLT
jgi:hypothetical protein